MQSALYLLVFNRVITASENGFGAMTKVLVRKKRCRELYLTALYLLRDKLKRVIDLITAYETIVEGNYIDNLVRAEKERDKISVTRT